MTATTVHLPAQMGKGDHVVDARRKQHHQDAKAQQPVVYRKLRQQEGKDRDGDEVADQKRTQKPPLT